MKKYKHKESGAELIARDEVQAVAFENAGFEFVEEVQETSKKK